MNEILLNSDLGAFSDSRCPDVHGQIPGLMFSNGQEWVEQRRFATRSLKDFGFGTMSMEEVIQVGSKKKC